MKKQTRISSIRRSIWILIVLIWGNLLKIPAATAKPSTAMSGVVSTASVDAPAREDSSDSDGHTSNWAVIVSTSRYWFNYRHASDALSFYHTVRRLGIPDSNIVLMLADDFACNPRNAFPGEVFNDGNHRVNLYGEAVQVDYRGTEVSVHAFLRVLTGRHEKQVPPSKRLGSDSNSNVLVYMSGHGGDDFLKFQDNQEMMGADLADAIAQMWEARRYRRMLLFVETCEAESLTAAVSSPNVLTVATSKLGEKSYSHHSDVKVGLHVIDRVTYYALEWFRTVGPTSNATLDQFLQYVRKQRLESTLVWDASRFPQPPSRIPVLDFFGSNPRVLPFPMSTVPAAASRAEDPQLFSVASPDISRGARSKSASDSISNSNNQISATSGSSYCKDSSFQEDVSYEGEGSHVGWPPRQHQLDVGLLAAAVGIVAATVAISPAYSQLKKRLLLQHY